MNTESPWPNETASRTTGSDAGVDIRRLFLGHKVILLLMIAVGATVGYWKFTQSTPEYATSAQVLVARNDVQLPVEGAQILTNQKSPLDKHIALLRTPVILKKAVENSDLSDLPSMLLVGDPAARIASGLSVQRSEESNEIIELAYRSTHREDCPIILNAVIDAYIDFVEESQKKLNSDTVALIDEAKEGLLEQLREKEATLQKFRDESPLVWQGEEALNIHQARLNRIEQQRLDLNLDQKLLAAELNSIEQALNKGSSRESILLMALNALPVSEKLGSNPQMQTGPATADIPLIEPLVDSVSAKLLPLRVKESKLLATHGVEHPDVVAIREEIELTRNLLQVEADARRQALLRHQIQLAERAEAMRPKLGEAGEEGPDLLATYIESLGGRLDVMQRKSDSLDTEYKAEEAKSRVVAIDENRHRALREDMDRTKRLFDVLLEKLQEFSLAKDGGLLAVEEIREPASAWQVAPKMLDNIVLGSLMGLLAGLGLSFALEMRDRSFRGPEQITQMLSLPVVGHISQMKPKSVKTASKLDKSLVAFHQRTSHMAEAFRAIRVPLLFGAKNDELQVLQVTSPDPGDGKSTVSANLAIVMANSGKRCLLIDCDLRRPKIHKLFGMSNNSGLSHVIEGDVELDDAIQKSEAENLDLLTAGGNPKNPAELILSPKLSEMLAVLRERYDFIIIDTPPVLAVTDAAAVASKVDKVMLVLRISKHVQLHAARARETLNLVEADIMGIVVNGVGGASYAGVYSANSSQYEYSYSNKYGAYGYGYKNYYGEQSRTDDDAPTTPSSSQLASHET